MGELLWLRGSEVLLPALARLVPMLPETGSSSTYRAQVFGAIVRAACWDWSGRDDASLQTILWSREYLRRRLVELTWSEQLDRCRTQVQNGNQEQARDEIASTVHALWETAQGHVPAPQRQAFLADCGRQMISVAAQCPTRSLAALAFEHAARLLDEGGEAKAAEGVRDLAASFDGLSPTA